MLIADALLKTHFNQVAYRLLNPSKQPKSRPFPDKSLYIPYLSMCKVIPLRPSRYEEIGLNSAHTATFSAQIWFTSKHPQILIESLFWVERAVTTTGLLEDRYSE